MAYSYKKFEKLKRIRSARREILSRVQKQIENAQESIDLISSASGNAHFRGATQIKEELENLQIFFHQLKKAPKSDPIFLTFWTSLKYTVDVLLRLGAFKNLLSTENFLNILQAYEMIGVKPLRSSDDLYCYESKKRGGIQ